MIKKTITYTDFNDKKQTEDFYFNLTKSELTEMQVSVGEGMNVLIEKITKAQDMKEIFSLFKKIVIASYGIKSEDGKHFRKSVEISDDFISSPAFDEFFMSIANDADVAAEFVKGIMPQDLAGKVEEAMKTAPVLAEVPMPDDEVTS